MVTDDGAVPGEDAEATMSRVSILCAGADVAAGGHREVTSSTRHHHLTLVTTGAVKMCSQDWLLNWLCKHTHTHTHTQATEAHNSSDNTGRKKKHHVYKLAGDYARCTHE